MRNGKYPQIEHPETWGTNFRKDLKTHDWLRVIYAWHEVEERSGLTICTIAGIIGKHPTKLLREMERFNRAHPGRLNLFLCGTTCLPVVNLSFNRGDMEWHRKDNDDYYHGRDQWNPMCVDLTRLHIVKYWGRAKTDAAKRGFSPYYEWLSRDTRGSDEDDIYDDGDGSDAARTIIEPATWKMLKQVAKEEEPTYDWNYFDPKHTKAEEY